jgi:hypothetical protein
MLLRGAPDTKTIMARKIQHRRSSIEINADADEKIITAKRLYRERARNCCG